MSYGEAWRLMRILLSDPSSQLAAALAGWEYPASRAELALLDLYDLEHVKGQPKRKPKPYPRPWGDKDRKKFGKTNLSPEQARAILDARRHLAPMKRDKNGRMRDHRGRFV